MEFTHIPLKSVLADALDRQEFPNAKKFGAYCFVLGGKNDKLYPDMLFLLHEVHWITGDFILVIMPDRRINGRHPNQDDIEAFHDQVVYGPGQRRNRAFAFNREKAIKANWMETQYEQVISLCDHLGILLSDLPCLVFFKSLQSSEYVIFPLRRDNPAQEALLAFSQIKDEVKVKFDQFMKTEKAQNTALRLASEAIVETGERKESFLREFRLRDRQLQLDITGIIEKQNSCEDPNENCILEISRQRIIAEKMFHGSRCEDEINSLNESLERYEMQRKALEKEIENDCNLRSMNATFDIIANTVRSRRAGEFFNAARDVVRRTVNFAEWIRRTF